MVGTAIDKILKALQTQEQSTAELADSLKLPLGTVRSTMSLLTTTGFTIWIPIKKRGEGFKPETTPGKRRGKHFRLTEKGKEYVENLSALEE